ncbi:FIG01046500: hypothetical protein CDS [Salmonella enterica subsp. enterica serovar Derby]|nr:FIG01046500: hypothetical protein CDS [Salmonella enterica subsp. enterica serovar Derby]
MDVPRLARIACEGRASLAITDCAGIICRRERCSKSALASNGVIISGFPTKRRVSCELAFSACNAAGTVTEGPKSPPMTSNARVRRVKVSSLPGSVFSAYAEKSSLSFITLVLFGFYTTGTPVMQKASSIARLLSDDLTAAVVTVGSDVVTQVFFTRRFVYRQAGDCGQSVMGTTHATFGTGWFILLYGHGPYSSITVYPCVRGEDLLLTL